MTNYQAKIYVTLKPSILDPQGRTVERALSHLNHANVGGVRIGKYIELNLSGEKAEAQMGEGKKSVAITARLQPRKATLTDKEIEAVAAKIVDKVAKATGI